MGYQIWDDGVPGRSRVTTLMSHQSEVLHSLIFLGIFCKILFLPGGSMGQIQGKMRGQDRTGQKGAQRGTDGDPDGRVNGAILGGQMRATHGVTQWQMEARHGTWNGPHSVR